MNPYSTELRRAMTLADQILALKQNRSLSEADAIQVDAGAFFPAISRWTQLCGFRMSGPPEAGKALLQKAVARWLRAAHQSGAAKAVVIKGVQALELFGVPLDQGNVVADALQVADQGRAHLVTADHQNVHKDSPHCRMMKRKYRRCLQNARSRGKNHSVRLWVQYSTFSGPVTPRSAEGSCVKFLHSACAVRHSMVYWKSEKRRAFPRVQKGGISYVLGNHQSNFNGHRGGHHRVAARQQHRSYDSVK
mgnify:CR=1 FL=1